jgi:hypothetical protein
VEGVEPGPVRFAWPGAGLVANVRGARIAVRLRSDGGTVFFQPLVDGVERARFGVAAGADREVTLASDLADGDHVVELYAEDPPWWRSSA